MTTKIALIAAVAPGRIIGEGNKMPWHMPRDLRFFRMITSGYPVIMGRKTFESLKKKALPNRRNIVVTRNQNYKAQGCEIAHSLEDAINMSANAERVFVIGGGQLYAAAISIADEIYLTEIFDKNPTEKLFPLFTGDTLFPKIEESDWENVHKGRHFIAANKIRHPNPKRNSGLYFRFLKFKRRNNKQKHPICLSSDQRTQSTK
jgi:dihydrofolate reductase